MGLRENFEAWVIKSNQDYETPEFLIERNLSGDYSTTRIQGAWEGYQEAAYSEENANSMAGALAIAFGLEHNYAKDAARYRWLRAGNAYIPEEWSCTGGEALDDLCDGQIAEEEKS